MRTVLLAIAWLVALCAPGFGQVQRGTIFGTITNEQGIILPGASVALNGLDRMEPSTTDAEGRYRFLNLPPGSYTITAELQGFKTFVGDNIVVVVGQNAEIPITLSVAIVHEPLLISGGSPRALDAPENHHGRPRRSRDTDTARSGHAVSSSTKSRTTPR
jgi:carboxypeptidase family protein